MKRGSNFSNMARHQEGVVLFMCLVMLLLLTALGASSIQTTTVQFQMARSVDDINLAFQAAEVGLRDGEDFIEGLASAAGFPDTANGNYLEVDPGTTPNWASIDWSANDGYHVGSTAVEGVHSQPRFIVEHVRIVLSDEDNLNLTNIGEELGTGSTHIFRITSRGSGFGDGSSSVFVQSHYGKRM